MATMFIFFVFLLFIAIAVFCLTQQKYTKATLFMPLMGLSYLIVVICIITYMCKDAYYYNSMANYFGIQKAYRISRCSCRSRGLCSFVSFICLRCCFSLPGFARRCIRLWPDSKTKRMGCLVWSLFHASRRSLSMIRPFTLICITGCILTICLHNGLTLSMNRFIPSHWLWIPCTLPQALFCFSMLCIMPRKLGKYEATSSWFSSPMCPFIRRITIWTTGLQMYWLKCRRRFILSAISQSTWWATHLFTRYCLMFQVLPVYQLVQHL